MPIICALFLSVKLVGEGIFVRYKNTSCRSCSRRRIPSTCTNHKLGRCPNANPSSVSPANSSHHLTWKGMLLVYLRVHMRGRQTAQMSLLTLHHLSVTSRFSSVQIKLLKQHRQLVRQHDRDARRDLVLVSWRC